MDTVGGQINSISDKGLNIKNANVMLNRNLLYYSGLQTVSNEKHTIFPWKLIDVQTRKPPSPHPDSV